MGIATRPQSSCFFEAIGNAYLAKGAEHWKIRHLERWRPARSMWSFLQDGVGLLPGVRIRDARVGAHRIRYWDMGRPDKPPVVLLHGVAASKENWLNLALLLRRGYRVLVPDLPGWGQSSFSPDEVYDADSQAERLLSWFDRLGLERGHWVGNSLGGAIAAVAASLAPERVETLTLMNAAGVAGAKRSRFEQGLIDGRNLLVAEHTGAVRELFLMVTHRNRHVLAALLTPVVAGDMAHRAPVTRRIFFDSLSSEKRLLERLPSLRMPALVLWGSHDQVLDPSCVDVFQRSLPNATTAVLPGVGHLPMLEAPLITARTLRSFWRCSRG